jgi:hypothetical protein
MAGHFRESARGAQARILFAKGPQRPEKAYLQGFCFSFRNVILIFFNTFNGAARRLG